MVLRTAAQLNGYGWIAVFHGQLEWEEAIGKEWFDGKPRARTRMRFRILYEQVSTSGSIVGD